MACPSVSTRHCSSPRHHRATARSRGSAATTAAVGGGIEGSNGRRGAPAPGNAGKSWRAPAAREVTSTQRVIRVSEGPRLPSVRGARALPRQLPALIAAAHTDIRLPRNLVSAADGHQLLQLGGRVSTPAAMTDAGRGLREWIESLGIREGAAIDAVVAMCHSQGCHTPSEAAGTATNQVFSEVKLKELLAGQKMNVRKKFFNGLESLSGRDRGAVAVAATMLPSPDAPVGSSASPGNFAALNLPSALPDASSSSSPNAPSAQSPAPMAGSPTSPGWSSGDRALVRELFELFNKSGDGRLDRLEYAAYCDATEDGAGCSEDRWRKVRVSAHLSLSLSLSLSLPASFPELR